MEKKKQRIKLIYYNANENQTDFFKFEVITT